MAVDSRRVPSLALAGVELSTEKEIGRLEQSTAVETSRRVSTQAERPEDSNRLLQLHKEPETS